MPVREWDHAAYNDAKRHRLQWLGFYEGRLRLLIVKRGELPEGWESDLPHSPLDSLEAFSQWRDDAFRSVQQTSDLTIAHSVVNNSHRWLRSHQIKGRPHWPDEPSSIAGCERELAKVQDFISSLLKPKHVLPAASKIKGDCPARCRAGG